MNGTGWNWMGLIIKIQNILLTYNSYTFVFYKYKITITKYNNFTHLFPYTRIIFFSKLYNNIMYNFVGNDGVISYQGGGFSFSHLFYFIFLSKFLHFP